MHRNMSLETTRWNPAEHLDSVEAVLAYLEVVFEDGNPELIVAALNDVARARGLQGAPGMDASVGLDEVIRTIKALGLELTAKAA